jgi:hypothetical protein
MRHNHNDIIKRNTVSPEAAIASLCLRAVPSAVEVKRELRKHVLLRKDFFFSCCSSTGTSGGGGRELVLDKRAGSFCTLCCLSIFFISPCDFFTA